MTTPFKVGDRVHAKKMDRDKSGEVFIVELNRNGSPNLVEMTTKEQGGWKRNSKEVPFSWVSRGADQYWFSCNSNLDDYSLVHSSTRTRMSTFIEKLRLLTATTEERLLVTYGLENPLGTPTKEGLDVLLDILYRENREKVKEAVKKIAAEEEKEKK